MQKRWLIKEANPEQQLTLSNTLEVHPIIAQLLINRGLTTIDQARAFLHAGLAQLHDPYLFKDMKIAVERIQLAQKQGERILLFGDYDVDGITSLTLLSNVLKEYGIDVLHHIPHRVRDGYGLNQDIAGFAKKEGVSLLITVDCGITAVHEVDELNKVGIEVMIVDHHEPLHDFLPKAVAIINPKQRDCAYPFKNLASVGLVAKFVQALLGKLSEDYLDLVAIGTIADIVPLVDENRIFVKAGLPIISKTKNKGLLALMDVAKIKDKKIRPHSIGFILGPRINAAGRMDSAHKSLDLFLAEDMDEAYHLARILEKHNQRRQKLQRDVIQEALEIVDREVNFKDHKVIVLSKDGWHKGVLGIVASRISDRYYRPAIVISLDQGMGTASARSIDGFHLHEALANCADYLENFGGHAGAAGLTIKEENIDPFRMMINQVADKELTAQHLVPTLTVDCDIPLTSVTLDLANRIDSLEPFGEGNPAPLFTTRGLKVKGSPAVLGRETLKFWVTDGHATVSAVGFGMAKYKELIEGTDAIDLVYHMTIDDWQKAPTVQMQFKDIKASENK